MRGWEPPGPRRISRRRFLAWSALALAGAAHWPGRAGAQAGEALRIGVVLPTKTGPLPLEPMSAETTGEPARLGALLAGERFVTAGGPAGLEVLIAAAPDAATAVRAGERLVSLSGASALVGGVGPGQAPALSRVAEERGVPFLNVGDPSDELRGAGCPATTFHVEASAAMYLDAIAASLALAGLSRVFFVTGGTAEQGARHQRALDALARHHPSGSEVGNASVPAGQALFLDLFEEIAASGADAVVLLLDPAEQLVLLGQYATSGPEVPVTGFPAAMAQTRGFYRALAQDAPDAGGTRVALWDAALEDEAAASLNERYLSRWGLPMDPSAWAAYAAVALLAQAAEAAGSARPDDLAARLLGEHDFDVAKGVPVSFRPWDRQLRQPLYLVRLAPGAADPRGAAEPVAHFPNLPAGSEGSGAAGEVEEALDLFGDGPAAGTCPPYPAVTRGAP